jgi:hypothetical protein
MEGARQSKAYQMGHFTGTQRRDGFTKNFILLGSYREFDFFKI